MTWTDVMAWERTISFVIGAGDGPITWWQMTIRGVLLFLYGVMLIRIAGPRACSAARRSST